MTERHGCPTCLSIRKVLALTIISRAPSADATYPDNEFVQQPRNMPAVAIQSGASHQFYQGVFSGFDVDQGPQHAAMLKTYSSVRTR